MPEVFSAKITGLETVAKNLKRMGAAGAKELENWLYRQGLKVQAQAMKNVPVDQGILRSSAHTERAKKAGGHTIVMVGFGGPAAPYAYAVHENPRAGRTGGVSPSGRPYAHWASVGGWKYLERALQEREAGMQSDMKELIDKVVR